jgi:hypothetical protein
MQRIALVEGLLDTASGLAQARIVEGYPDQALRAKSQSPLQDGPKQLLGLPAAAGMQEILRAPTAQLASVGPDDAGKTTPPQAHQRAQGLPHGALEGALLRKHVAPILGNGEELG